MGKAREAALEALERCRKDGAWSANTIDGAIKKHALDRRDAALASRLVLGVLQNNHYCDYYIDLFRRGGREKLQPKLRDILRLGAYQLLFLDRIPAHSAVSESVELCRAAGCDRASGLVNAVLRRIAENRQELPPLPEQGSAAGLSLRYSHPQWLVERLLDEHEPAFVEAFLAANNETPPLTIRVNTLRIDADSYRRALLRSSLDFKEREPGCFELPGGAVTELPGYDEGLFYVQDRAAQLAVLAAGPCVGMRILDACAAPGGKSFAAAIAMEDRGDILSCDIHEKKLNLVRSGARRLGIESIECRAADARVFQPELAESFDIVLADLPCSGLGVIRRRPEIRRKSEEDIAALPEIQEAILDTIWRYVKPGGVLLYSTCTVLRAENEDRVEHFLRGHPDFSPEDFCVGDIASRGGMYGFWPQTDGSDGFFAAKMRRRLQA